MNKEQFDRAQEKYDAQVPDIGDDDPEELDFSDDEYEYGSADYYEEDYE
jgi:hypothetical protein